MVGGILGGKAFKLGNIGGELGGRSKPTNIVADRIIDQLMEIGETESCHIREQRDSQGSSCGGSASNRPSNRTGVRARSGNRHGEGNRGGTKRRGRTRTIRGRFGVRTQGRTYSMMTGRRKSTNRKLRVKAKNSPG